MQVKFWRIWEEHDEGDWFLIKPERRSSTRSLPICWDFTPASALPVLFSTCEGKDPEAAYSLWRFGSPFKETNPSQAKIKSNCTRPETRFLQVHCWLPIVVKPGGLFSPLTWEGLGRLGVTMLVTYCALNTQSTFSLWSSRRFFWLG